MDARRLIEQQHQEVRGLFKRVTATDGNGQRDLQERDALLARLTARLQLHTRLEETYFYPALQSLDTKKAEETVLESYEEHAIVDGVLAELPAMEARNERFLARVRVMQFLVDTHMEEEETVMFELAAKLGEERLIAIGQRMQMHSTEVESLERAIVKAAEAARRTERWAGRWIDSSLDVSRRALSRVAPTRLLRLDERVEWISALAAKAPFWLIDGACATLQRIDGVLKPPAAGGGQAPSTREAASARAVA